MLQQPSPQKLDCWVNIPYTYSFFTTTQNYETENFIIHELLKPHKTYLSEGEHSYGKIKISFSLIYLCFSKICDNT